MTEKEPIGLRDQITHEIAESLRTGHFLLTEDFKEIASRYGLSPSMGNPYAFKSSYDDRFFIYEDVRARRDRFKGYFLFTNADMPIEETNYKSVIEEVIKRRHDAAVKSALTSRLMGSRQRLAQGRKQIRERLMQER